MAIYRYLPTGRLLFLLLTGWGASGFPWFSSSRLYVSVFVGGDVNLSCVAKDYEGQWVRWDKVDTGHIIAIEAHILIQDPRLSVSLGDDNTWTLRIRKIKKDDSGPYRCTVNTKPISSQTVFLEVLEVPAPPTITTSSPNMTVDEGSSINLTCEVTGYPIPTVIWTRDDHNPINMFNNETDEAEKQQISHYIGKTLSLTEVSRHDKGTYKCTANNSMSPTAMKTINLDVIFKPEIQVINPLIIEPAGSEVSLNCTVETSQTFTNHWMRENDAGNVEILELGKEYRIVERHNDYNVKMTLIIKELKPSLAGTYFCMATNNLGRAEGKIELHAVQAEPTRIPKEKMSPSSEREEQAKHPFANDINPKRGQEQISDQNSPSSKGKRKGMKGVFYNIVTFLRFFGLLMSFH